MPSRNPDDAADILIAANSDVLTDRAFIRASLQALIDGNYFRSAKGAIGTIDPAKMEATAEYLIAAGILRDKDGVPLSDLRDLSAYYTNKFIGQ